MAQFGVDELDIQLDEEDLLPGVERSTLEAFPALSEGLPAQQLVTPETSGLSQQQGASSLQSERHVTGSSSVIPFLIGTSDKLDG